MGLHHNYFVLYIFFYLSLIHNFQWLRFVKATWVNMYNTFVSNCLFKMIFVHLIFFSFCKKLY
ncbi:hypothetical protein BDC45DRAFT_507753, partial [Circinella umbellata]